jgi:diacylglycerol kinase (ATP)
MIRRFCALLDDRGVKTDVHTTTGPNDATLLAAEAVRNGAREVIVSGGDGTINEALQSLIGHDVRLAVWPRGTANVLGRELKLPRRLDRLADLIAAGNVLRVHPGIAISEATGERRYFVLMAGVGLERLPMSFTIAPHTIDIVVGH